MLWAATLGIAFTHQVDAARMIMPTIPPQPSIPANIGPTLTSAVAIPPQPVSSCPSDNGGCCIDCVYNRFCRNNGGCYSEGQPGCDVDLCPAPGPAPAPNPPAPAPVPIPPPAPPAPPAPAPSPIDSRCFAEKRRCCLDCEFNRLCPSTGGCYRAGQAGCDVDLCPAPGPAPAPNPPAPAPVPIPPPAPPAPPAPAPVPAPPIPAPDPASDSDLLQPISVEGPPSSIFEYASDHFMPPRHVAWEAPGPYQTNKFWANWISGHAGEQTKNIFTAPYTLKWTAESRGWGCHYYENGQDNAWCQSNPIEKGMEHQYLPGGPCGCDCCKRAAEIRAELLISHNREPTYQYNTGAQAHTRPGRIAFYFSRFISEFSLGVTEATSADHYSIVREDLLGIHAVVRGDGTDSYLRFPVYSGMAYVSGRYSGFTPRINSPQGWIKEVTKVRDGVWSFKNDAGNPNKLWQCHYYGHNENDAWCQANPTIDAVEYKYFGPGTGCACDCCRRPQQLPGSEDDFGTEFRVYVLDTNGNFAAGEFTNSSDGTGFFMDRQLDGWVRVAHVLDDKDRYTLDAHAGTILEGIQLEVRPRGAFSYKFETSGQHGSNLLHWAYGHQTMLMDSFSKVEESQITSIIAPTKGAMVPLLGDRWDLQVDIGPASSLDFLPPGELTGSRRDEVMTQLNDGLLTDVDAERCLRSEWWDGGCARARTFMLTGGFYTNGKGLQKVGTYCVLAEKMFGLGDSRTQHCVNLLKRTFKCHYDAGSCKGAPKAYYDQAWGGAVSQRGYRDGTCGFADFGNACYNDHHYHYGYFIAAASMLLKLKPEMADEPGFVDYINTLVRDTANPSTEDRFFPQFRAFDWYELHSWSHGVTPSGDGKDEESTSEDINHYWGVQMWGRMTGNAKLEQTGATLLSLLAHTARSMFLLKTGNPFHHPDYVKNHVTGIFFQNKAHYGTFFGAEEWFIHGVQSLPLSPALLLARTPEYCRQVHDDIIGNFDLRGITPGWGSLLLTGNMAIFDPNRAYEEIKFIETIDPGLSRPWALYWAASLAAR